MSASADPDPARALDLRSAVRHTGPSRRIAEVTDLLEEAAALLGSRDELLEGVESVTGLRPGELAVLVAVAEGAEHSRQIGRDTGQADAAAAATVEVLVRRGLLAHHHHERAAPQETPTLVHVTESGRVTLAQMEALRIRLTDAVVDALGEDQVRRVREAAAVVHAAVTAGPAGGARPEITSA